MVIGKIEEREYNGKTYTDIVAETLFYVKKSLYGSEQEQKNEQGNFDSVNDDDDGVLPF